MSVCLGKESESASHSVLLHPRVKPASIHSMSPCQRTTGPNSRRSTWSMPVQQKAAVEHMGPAYSQRASSEDGCLALRASMNLQYWDAIPVRRIRNTTTYHRVKSYRRDLNPPRITRTPGQTTYNLVPYDVLRSSRPIHLFSPKYISLPHYHQLGNAISSALTIYTSLMRLLIQLLRLVPFSPPSRDYVLLC